MSEPDTRTSAGPNTRSVLVAVLAVCFAVLWLYERFKPPVIVERPVPKRTEVLVPIEKIKEVPVETIKEVVKEVQVPAALTESQQSALEFSSNYVDAPYLSGMDEALFNVDSLCIEVNLKPAIQQVISADELRRHYEQALRRSGVRINPNSAFLLGINYDGFWNDAGDRLVYGVYMELYDSVMLERQGDLRRTYAIVWVHNYLGSASSTEAQQHMLSNAETNAAVLGEKWAPARATSEELRR